METKKSMDPSRIAMVCTDNESVYMKVRAEGYYFRDDNLPEDQRSKQITKEPEIDFIAEASYPLKYVMDFLKLAKSQKANHIRLYMGLGQAPIKIAFESDDMLNLNDKNKLTWYYLAPRIDDEEETPELIKSKIDILSKKIEFLKLRLPKEPNTL